MAARTGVLPPPPPQKRVPCASSPQWIDCPVEGAKAKSAGKGVRASFTSIQSFEEPKSMQNEVEMSSVNEHNSGSGRSPVMFNPPPPPKKKHILSYTHHGLHHHMVLRNKLLVAVLQFCQSLPRLHAKMIHVCPHLLEFVERVEQ